MTTVTMATSAIAANPHGSKVAKLFSARGGWATACTAEPQRWQKRAPADNAAPQAEQKRGVADGEYSPESGVVIAFKAINPLALTGTHHDGWT